MYFIQLVQNLVLVQYIMNLSMQHVDVDMLYQCDLWILFLSGFLSSCKTANSQINMVAKYLHII